MSKKKSVVRRGNRERQLKTIFGDVSVKIQRYWCQTCQKVFDDPILLSRLDTTVPKGSNVTAGLRRIATLCGASWPYEQAEKILAELTGTTLSHNQIKKLCAWEAQSVLDINDRKKEASLQRVGIKNARLAEQTPLSPDWGKIYPPENLCENPCQSIFVQPHHSSEEERFYIGLDGVLISDRKKRGRIEAKVATLFTSQRACISKNRNLLLNKQIIGTFNGISVFRQRVFDAAQQVGALKAKELILLGDGAGWIRKMAETDYSHARLILDWWHLKERVHQALREPKRLGFDPIKTSECREQLISDLWLGKVDVALRTLRHFCRRIRRWFFSSQMASPPIKDLQDLYRYIKNNAATIVNYDAFQRQGYFISSVFTEKTNDILVCRRQKLRSQHWSRKGAEDVIILRQLILNGQWDSYWEQALAA